MKSETEADSTLHDSSGALFMVNKDERKLLKELLNMAVNSDGMKDYITKRLGQGYVEIADKLYKEMGGS